MTDDSMNQERSSDVVTKSHDAFRSAARGGAGSRYACILCNATSHSGPKLWEHVKKAHPQILETRSSIEKGELKELFLDNAYVNL